jgi:hypothetical protein
MEDGADFMRYNFLGMMLLDQHDSGAAHFLPGAADFAAGSEAKKIPAIVADGREKGIWGNTEEKVKLNERAPAPHAPAP